MTVGLRNTDDIEEQIRSAVSGSSIFGRLVALSALRHQDGIYYHQLSWRHGVTAVDTALRRVHRETFEIWLTLSLQQQVDDLTKCHWKRGRPISAIQM